MAADKQGVDEDKFYKDLLKKANQRFDTHLAALKAAEVAKKAKLGKRKK